jgi:hypothetical protein
MLTQPGTLPLLITRVRTQGKRCTVIPATNTPTAMTARSRPPRHDLQDPLDVAMSQSLVRTTRPHPCRSTHTISLTNFNHGHRSFSAAHARSGPPARHGPHCRTRSCTAPVRIHTAPCEHTPPPARSARAPQPSRPLPHLACLRRAVAPPSAQLSRGRLF